MKTTPGQRAGWRKLLDAATKGTWRVRGYLISAVDGDVSCPIADLRTPYRRGVGLARGERETVANSKLISSAREALPALLADLEEMEKENANLRRLLRRLLDEDGHVRACGNGGEDGGDCSPLCHEVAIAIGDAQ